MVNTARLLSALAGLALSSTVSAQTYDYVIVGGGTSGLVIANRLSEAANVTVAVIEAGGSVYSNPNVTDTNGYSLAFGTDIDYSYSSVAQKYAGNSTTTLRAGKALGGTSTINGMVYTRAEDAQIDAWNLLGNEGWNWTTLYPYYKKSESLSVPDFAQQSAGAAYDPSVHGYSGPLKTGWTYNLNNGSYFELLNSTYDAVGIPYSPDVNGGKMRGFSSYLRTVDNIADVREDAARAYYFPFQNRSNVDVFLWTRGDWIVWDEDSDEVTAKGVQVTAKNGTSFVIGARKEVVLSAGSLRSPALLEYSGVGNPDILEKFGISVKVDLPTVGENLQDQMNNGLAASMNQNATGSSTYVAYPSFSDIVDAETFSSLAASIKSSLSSYAAQVSAASNGVVSQVQLETFFKIQYDLIFEDKIPIAEILFTPTGDALDAEYWGLLPFSRGNVHISSADTSAAPAIDPNYFMLDFDMTQQRAAAQFIRKMMTSSPLSSVIVSETKPGYDSIPQNTTSDAWDEWIISSYRSNFHPVATAAMMPKELGGVVDNRLKVYGTQNVRVVDASVLPMQVCGHLVSTLYAVAERAADLIKEDQ